MTAEWVLEEESLGQLALDPDDGFAVTGYNLGFPAVRAVVDPNADGDGETDVTALTGGRIVSLDVRITGDKLERRSRAMTLRQWLEPRRRPIIRWSSGVWGDLRAVCRGDQFAHQVGTALGAATIRMAWRCPVGVWEAYDSSEVQVFPGSGATTGRVYNLTFDRVYPAASIPGLTTFTAGGTTRSYPLLRIVGPVTAPVVALPDSGGYWSFPALTVLAGDWVDINCRDRTALLDSLPASSVFNSLDFATLKWGWIEPGPNSAQFSGTSTTVQSSLRVMWRDAYL